MRGALALSLEQLEVELKCIDERRRQALRPDAAHFWTGVGFAWAVVTASAGRAARL